MFVFVVLFGWDNATKEEIPIGSIKLSVMSSGVKVQLNAPW